MQYGNPDRKTSQLRQKFSIFISKLPYCTCFILFFFCLVLKFWDLTEHNTLENNWLRMMTTGISFSLDMSAKKKAAASAIGQGLFNTFFKVGQYHSRYF